MKPRICMCSLSKEHILNIVTYSICWKFCEEEKFHAHRGEFTHIKAMKLIAGKSISSIDLSRF